ncbi:DUF4190 domain-containing protein, partial [Mycolicibacterium fortuitum]|uniref:DUF4190 domain-containing protein n=1 Tax=Mycolicibacterium fortuitum TaxID=1766 RepID=UPI0034CEC5D6
CPAPPPPPPGRPPPGACPAGGAAEAGSAGGTGRQPGNPTTAVALGSLAASVLGVFLLFGCGIGLLAALVGIGLGIVALNQIKQSAPAGYGPQAEQPGRGLAVAGIALGAFGTLLNGGWLLFFVASVLST